MTGKLQSFGVFNGIIGLLSYGFQNHYMNKTLEDIYLNSLNEILSQVCRLPEIEQKEARQKIRLECIKFFKSFKVEGTPIFSRDEIREFSVLISNIPKKYYDEINLPDEFNYCQFGISFSSEFLFFYPLIDLKKTVEQIRKDQLDTEEIRVSSLEQSYIVYDKSKIKGKIFYTEPDDVLRYNPEPIIVVNDKISYRVIDGNHRSDYAVKNKLDTICAYILDIEFLIENDLFSFDYNKKLVEGYIKFVDKINKSGWE